MQIAGLQKTTLIDFPGKIAAVIFTQGCSFRCGYCHNPELVDPKQFRDPFSEDYIFSFLKKRKAVLEGVVITGGEPLIHRDIKKFLSKIKSLGYKIKLDTNGTSPDLLQEIIDEKIVDYIAMDIKHHLARYSEITRVETNINDIKKSIDCIMNCGLMYEFRTTILPKFFCENDFTEIGKLIKGTKIYYLQQFRPMITLDPSLVNESSFSEAKLNIFKKILSNYVDKCEIRGII